MQAWSAKRAAAIDTFRSQNDSLVASLGGNVDAYSAMMGQSGGSSVFISNDALSSSLFGGVSNILAGEETLIAQRVYTRACKSSRKRSWRRSTT